MPNFRRPMTLILAAVMVALAAFAASPPRLQQALEAQRELIRSEPGNAEALNDYGNLLALAGDLDGARDAYHDALAIDPAVVGTRYNLALLYQQRGELSAAHQELKGILRQEPGHAWAWFQVGAVQELRGRHRGAVSAYVRAFELDPQLSFADVNPQIIDSRLTAKALLRVDAGRTSASEAPRSYAQPAHVTALLLPPHPAADEVGEEETRTASVAPLSTQREEADQESGRQPEVRILTLDDLEPGSRIGEATPAVPAPDRRAPGRGRPRVGGGYDPGSSTDYERSPPGITEDWGTPTSGRVQMRRDDG